MGDGTDWDGDSVLLSSSDTSRNKAPRAEGNHPGWLSVGRALSGFARWGGGSQHRWNFVRDLSTEPAVWESGGKLHPWQAFTLRRKKQCQKGSPHWDHSVCFTYSPSAPPYLKIVWVSRHLQMSTFILPLTKPDPKNPWSAHTTPAPRPKKNKPEFLTAHSRAAQGTLCQFTLKAGGTLWMPDPPEQSLRAKGGIQHLSVHH